MNYFREIIENDADPRVANWYFMSNPLPTIIVTLIYMYVVKKLGPQLMQNRKPFHLTNVIIFYNAAQVALSAYLVFSLLKYGLLRYNSLFCEPINLEDTELINIVWWYFFAKFTELIETIFFVLRKKNNQISTLHVFHHSVMPTIAWIGLKYSPGGPGAVFGTLNSFVHVIMYTYYMFAAMGPKYQKYLWWKRYLTIIQLVQFSIVISHSVLIITSDCNVNKIFSYSLLTVVVAFFILFSDFYKKTYSKKSQKKAKIDNNYSMPGSSFMSPREQYEKPNRS